jgi:NADH:ubiquinone oxidoreductase subunit F (NADH-binding)
MVWKKDWRTSSACIVGVELEIETNSNIKHFKAGSHCVGCCAACRLGLNWSKSLARSTQSSGTSVLEEIGAVDQLPSSINFLWVLCDISSLVAQWARTTRNRSRFLDGFSPKQTDKDEQKRFRTIKPLNNQ